MNFSQIDIHYCEIIFKDFIFSYLCSTILSDMKKNTLLMILVAILFMVACKNEKKEVLPIGLNTHIEGDSTLYGLACDGCTDSVLVFLSGKGGDPVTYDIIDAMSQHNIIGRPHVGDWVAVLTDPEDSTKAAMVINLDELKGTWTQKKTPILKERIHNTALSEEEQARMDSAIQKMMQPVDIGFALKRHYTAAPVGMSMRSRAKNDSPVIMPMPKFYVEWHVFNGQLVLKERQFTNVEGKRTAVEKYDTASFVMMTRDSLVLRFKDGEQSYSRQH